MVGLDVTRRALIRVDEFEGGGSFRAAMRDLIQVYARFARKSRGAEDITLHDPLVLAVAMKPDLVETIPCRVDVDASRGIARGMTVVDLRENRGRRVENPVHVAMDLDVKDFLAFFVSHLQNYRGWDADEE